MRNGFHYSKVAGAVQRYKCGHCGTSFSDRTFSIDYYVKKSVNYGELLEMTVAGECVSRAGRSLGCSCASTQNRLDRMARNLLAMHQELEGRRALGENLVADGFEGFDVSQYYPSHVSLVVGQISQLIYALDHASMRRKGRMTEAQKAKRAELELRWKPKRGSLGRSFAQAMQIIPLKWDKQVMPKLSILTDEHPAYPGAIRSVEALDAEYGKDLVHETYSSKLPRDLLNPLFSVNYMDRELRKDVAAHARESTCIGRNVANGLSRLAVYMAWHNYWKQYRLRTKDEAKRRPHAECAGVAPDAIEDAKRRCFVERAFLSKAGLDPWARDIWLKRHPTPLKSGADYLQKHAGGSGRASKLR
jgi:transposase-like protein